jgi:GntR family transcriptional regulator, rspAB operon transcriptional repressor
LELKEHSGIRHLERWGRLAPLPAMTLSNRPRTRTVSATIYDSLREELVSLHRKPGEPLSEKEIAAGYAVSRTPVREAILRLADEGLIDIFPQSGTFVSRIPIAALPEALVIRKALEETMARLAAERATSRQIQELEAGIRRQRELGAMGNQDAFHGADEDFHALLAMIAGYPGVWRLVQQVKLQVDRFRRLTLPQRGRMRRVVREHAGIAVAIKQHNPQEAARRMASHLDALLVDLKNLQNVNPEYFSTESISA